MPRNAEVIRQWKILRTLEASRRGETIAGLARLCEVTQRTVWRDIAALQESGFPLVDEKPNGLTRWKLLPHGLNGLVDCGLSISELASLYFSRALIECLVGTPFQEDATSGLEKIAAALPPRMRAFLDRLPAVLNVKATPLKKREEVRYRKHIAALLTAVLDHRQVKMQYYSASSRQTKEYLVEPCRLAYAQGGDVSAGAGPEISPASDLRGRAHQIAVGDAGDLRRGGGSRVRPLPQLAGSDSS